MEKDKPEWYEVIRNEIYQQHKTCVLKGEAWYPSLKNAFLSKSKEELQKRYNQLYQNTRDKYPMEYCKNYDNHTNNSLDGKKRYYKGESYYLEDCKKKKGVWNQNSINRQNKYSKGVCWANEEEERCGRITPQSLIIPELKKKSHRGPKANDITGLKESFNQIKQNCEKANCSWDKTTNDCMAKKVEIDDGIEKDRAKIKDPPSSISRDITKDGPQKALFDWYTHDKPSLSPATDVLIGDGNRCTGEKAYSGDENGDENGVVVNLKHNYLYTKKELMSFRITTDEYQYNVFKTIIRKAVGNRLGIEIIHVYNTKPFNVKYLNTIWDTIDEHTDMYNGIDNLEGYNNYYEYHEKLNSKFYEKEKEDEKEKNKFLPSISQSVMNIVMKNIVNTNSTNRGLLGWHSTGSGKTCTAAGIMDAFWDSNRQIVFASSIDAIASNPDYKFHECAVRLFPRFKEPPFNSDLRIIANRFFERGIIFISFAKLANRIQKMGKLRHVLKNHREKDVKRIGKKHNTIAMEMLINRVSEWYNIANLELIRKTMRDLKITRIDDVVDLDNAVLIIDEVHNLFRPLANQKEKHRYVEKHIVDPTAHTNLKVVILTATPGDNVTDVMKLLNIIRDPNNPVIVPPKSDEIKDIVEFQTSIKGLISFFDMSNDKTKFPTVFDNGPVKYPMSLKQFSQYVEKYKEVKDGMKNYDKLAKENQLNKYWQSARKYSNMLYTFDKSMQLTEFSSKLPALLGNFTLYPSEKHYCYSSFYTNHGSGQGILEIARQLEKQGYKKLTLKEAKDHNANRNKLIPQKRYMLAIQSEFGADGTTSAGNNLHELIKIYNSDINKSGDYVHVFLASQGFNEGLDLKAVRHIHIFEPLLTAASDLQTIGRARRFCSHSQLNQKDWTVNIHRYLSDFPVNISLQNTEQSILSEIDKQQLVVAQLQAQMKEEKDKTGKADLKTQLAEIKKHIANYKKQLASSKKMDVANIKNIDEIVYNEALEKMKLLFVIYHSMKNAAIDCRLLSKFHDDPSLVCMNE